MGEGFDGGAVLSKYKCVVVGEARELPLPDESVQCVVTSPPYWGLRNYGVEGQIGLEPTPDLYVQHLVEVFREVWRVLRADGTVWCNLGDSYIAAQGGRQSAAGLMPMETKYTKNEPRDRHGLNHMSSWSSRDVTAKVLTTREVGLKPKDLAGIPWRVAFALQAAGWWLRSDIIWSKPNPMPESVTDRPTKAHEYVFLLSKSASYYFDQEAVRERSVCEKMPGKNMTDTRITYGEQNGGNSGLRDLRRKVRSPAGWDIGNGAHGSIHRDGREQAIKYNEIIPDRNLRSVWTIATQPFPDAHFATFPEKLVEPCVKAGSREGDLVLDPFSGSGTVGCVALGLGRRFIGVDLKYDYCKMAHQRMVIALYAIKRRSRAATAHP